MNTRLKFTTLAASLGFLAPMSVQAQGNRDSQVQVSVYYGDLDLSHQAGAQELIGRLEVAASKVCGGMPDIRDLTRFQMYRACTKHALDKAVASVGQPIVSALYGEPLQQTASSR
jgi:UrcA family protein